MNITPTARRLGLRALALAALPVLLTACGGGSDPNASDREFPLRTAYAAMIRDGESPMFSVSGSCTGRSWQTSAPAVAGEFEGVQAQAIANTSSMELSDCTPATSGSSSTSFYDANTLLLGGVSADGSVYRVVPQPHLMLPTTVRVGDSGQRDTELAFTDSTKTTQLGYYERSFQVEAYTDTTAIVNFVSRRYNTSRQLLDTVQNRYRIDETGKLFKLSIDIQYNTGSSRHLLLTRI